MLAVTGVFTFASAAGETKPSMSSRAIDEKMFVSSGGIDQWITIKGQDRHNPAVLFLNGGPGDPLSASSAFYDQQVLT